MKEGTPANIRARAVLDLIDAYKTANAGFRARISKQNKAKGRWKKRKKKAKIKDRHRWKKRRPFDIKYKSKRLTSDSFGFESSNIRTEGNSVFLFSRCNKYEMREAIKMSEPLRQPSKMCCRVQYCYGRWYLLVPFKDQVDQEHRTNRFVSLDPGVRTFQTYYSEDEAGEIGFDVAKRIDKINNKIKSIRKRLEDAKSSGSRKVKRLRRAWYRANARSSDLVTDLHW